MNLHSSYENFLYALTIVDILNSINLENNPCKIIFRLALQSIKKINKSQRNNLIIYYAFLRRIQKEKKQQYIKYKVFTDKKAELEAINDAQSHEKLSNDFLNEKGSADFHIHIKEFIDDMEKKEAEKKNKREQKKAERESKTKKVSENNLAKFMV